MRLKSDVLSHVLALDNLLVVELDLQLFSIRGGTKNVNLLFLGEITEAAT
jgi:hypothetical protein